MTQVLAIRSSGWSVDLKTIHGMEYEDFVDAQRRYIPELSLEFAGILNACFDLARNELITCR